MANLAHLDLFKQGVNAWNVWRTRNPTILPDLSFANLRGASLIRADLTRANLRGADLTRANLRRADLKDANLRGTQLRKSELLLADLRGANLSEANLSSADLKNANLCDANLSKAEMSEADLRKAYLRGANLVKANLRAADFRESQLSFSRLNFANLSEANFWKCNLSFADLSFASLSKANLSLTDLSAANFSMADLSFANLSFANLSKAILIETNLTEAVLSGCTVQGVSLGKIQLEKTRQENLVIISESGAVITLDNLKLGQFLALLLDNQEIQNTIETMTMKAVLILGHFTTDRKNILDALRETLRQQHYLPISFDFEKPMGRDLIETLETLARLVRFILVDITEPDDVLPDFRTILPALKVPVQPIFQGEKMEQAMLADFKKYPLVRPVSLYKDRDALSRALPETVLLFTKQKLRSYELQR